MLQQTKVNRSPLRSDWGHLGAPARSRQLASGVVLGEPSAGISRLDPTTAGPWGRSNMPCRSKAWAPRLASRVRRPVSGILLSRRRYVRYRCRRAPGASRCDLQGWGARGGPDPRQDSPAVSSMEDVGAGRLPAGPEHLHLVIPRPAGPAPTGEAKPPPPPCRPSLVRPPFPSAPAGRRELRPRESKPVGGPRRSWTGSCPSEVQGCPCTGRVVQEGN